MNQKMFFEGIWAVDNFWANVTNGFYELQSLNTIVKNMIATGAFEDWLGIERKNFNQIKKNE
jgi:hypothetical protein